MKLNFSSNKRMKSHLNHLNYFLLLFFLNICSNSHNELYMLLLRIGLILCKNNRKRSNCSNSQRAYWTYSRQQHSRHNFPYIVLIYLVYLFLVFQTRTSIYQIKLFHDWEQKAHLTWNLVFEVILALTNISLAIWSSKSIIESGARRRDGVLSNFVLLCIMYFSFFSLFLYY